MTEFTVTLTAAERDLLGRALSDRRSICLATREDAERHAAGRLHMRLQEINIAPDHIRDAAPSLLAALRELIGLYDGGKTWAPEDHPVVRARAAIAAAEGREITDAPKVEPSPVDFEQRRDGWLVAFVPISSAARQWSIDATPKGARWEHERWYAQKNRAPAVRHAIEAEGFTVREG